MGRSTKKPQARRYCDRPAVSTKSDSRQVTAAAALPFSFDRAAVPYAAQAEVQPAAAAAAEAAASPAVLHFDCAPVQVGHAALAEAD